MMGTAPLVSICMGQRWKRPFGGDENMSDPMAGKGTQPCGVPGTCRGGGATRGGQTRHGRAAEGESAGETARIRRRFGDWEVKGIASDF